MDLPTLVDSNPEERNGTAGTEKQARRRSKKACDLCRARRIKCIWDRRSCKACQDQEVLCLWTTPTKQRGPPSKYVKAHRDRQVISNVQSTSQDTQMQEKFLDVPFTVIESLILEWFELYYCVCPIFHRHSFLRRLRVRHYENDNDFTALVLSVCAATIANLRRTAGATQNWDVLTVERCMELIETTGFLTGRKQPSLERCQTLYNMAVALMSLKSIDDAEQFCYFAEAVAGVKHLIYYEMPSMSMLDQQLLKRLFWLLFAGECTASLHGRPYLGVLGPEDNINYLRPLEIRDPELDASEMDPSSQWHGDHVSYVPGLNFLSKLFLLWRTSQQHRKEPQETLEHLLAHIDFVRSVVQHLPPELKWRGDQPKPQNSNFGTDVQMTNLYVTQLHIRYNTLEQIKDLSQKSSAIRINSPAVLTERRNIINDMLELLKTIPHDILQANGFSLVNKIRDIGSALLEDAANLSPTGTSPGSPQTEEISTQLALLLETLERLDWPTDPMDRASTTGSRSVR